MRAMGYTIPRNEPERTGRIPSTERNATLYPTTRGSSFMTSFKSIHFDINSKQPRRELDGGLGAVKMTDHAKVFKISSASLGLPEVIESLPYPISDFISSVPPVKPKAGQVYLLQACEEACKGISCKLCTLANQRRLWV